MGTKSRKMCHGISSYLYSSHFSHDKSSLLLPSISLLSRQNFTLLLETLLSQQVQFTSFHTQTHTSLFYFILFSLR